MYEIPPKRYKENLAEFTELLGLEDFLNIPAGKISLGQRMRADLCMALLHDPKLLYLDEPTIGLDIAVKDSIRRFVRSLVEERGTTVMLTTHDLGDIEDMCRRIVIIDNGKIIHDGDLVALKDTYARDLVIHFQLAHRPTEMGPICAGLPACEIATDGLRRSSAAACAATRAPATDGSGGGQGRRPGAATAPASGSAARPCARLRLARVGM
jgi:ABC-2 type transport system ATP-binding protein